MEPITKQQIIAIKTLFSKHRLSDDQRDIVRELTDNRTEHVSELYFHEAVKLIAALNTNKPVSAEELKKQRMMAKLFAMAHELGWIKKEMKVVGSQLKESKNYDTVYDWVLKYGYKKKILREYTYDELPKLITQFELGPYKSYIVKH